MLRINVTDANGVASALALNLSDYVSNTENSEYISIQAVDLTGNKSGIIEIKNPYYNPEATPVIVTPTQVEPPQSSQSAIPDGSRPLTPDGTGTVIDNVHDGDGKEFFTIDTEDGSIFYLIIDRQRNTDNVYLLNAVTLDDLVALAEKNDTTLNVGNNGSTSAVQTPEQPNTTEEQNQSSETTPEAGNEKSSDGGNNNNMIIFVVVVVCAAGIAGYYFKIVKGKKKIYDDDEENDDDNEDDYGYGSDPDEDDEDDGDGGDDE
jgi:hypothetical protein